MKPVASIFILLFTFLVSCSENRKSNDSFASKSIDTSIEITNTIIDDSLLHFDNQKSLWTLDGQLYSGYAVSYYPDGILKEKIGFLNGKKQDQAIRWYPDGHFKQVANYHKGKLHGEKKTWSADTSHVLISRLNYRLGKAHGEQTLWYPTGELYKKLMLKMGREEGLQQAFRKNGDLYANYEARAGRIFGLKKAALCYGLEDEKIQYEN